MNTAQLRQWLAAGKTERVLEELLRETVGVDPDLHHEATLLSARFENLSRQKRLGTVEFEDEARELAQINHAALDIINQLDKAGRPGGIPSWAKAAAAVLVVLGLLGGVGYAAGWFEKDTVAHPDTTAQIPAGDTAAQSPVAEPAQRPTQPSTTPPETQKPAPNPKFSNPKQSSPKTSNPKPSKPETTETSTLKPLPPPGEALSIGCKTDKGRGSVHYRAGQDMRFYFTVNQACYMRAIYQLADGRLVLLADDRRVTASETEQWLEIGPGFEVAEPFGDERVYVFAQTTPFPALATRAEADGYLFIIDGLPEALRKTRGFKRKQVFAEADVMFRTHP